MTKLEKAIRKIIHTCLRLHNNESFLILIDQPNRELGYLLLKTALRVNKDALLIETKKHKEIDSEPSAVVKLLLKQIEAVIVVSSSFLTHHKTLRTACHYGARVLCLSKLSLEIIERSVNTNFEFIVEKSNRISDLLSIGKIVTLTTPAGTDITIPISRRKGVADTGMAHEPGMFATLPAGEACITPETGKAEGIVVIDGSLGPLGLVQRPIELKIKDGYIQKIFGGDEAQYLRKKLKTFGKEARNFAELGIGTNPKAIIAGKSIEDEKVLGTAHIAIGDPSLEGGSYHGNCHIDAILKNPTIEIDGHLILKDGMLLV
ncbi:MAG: aminopeptidase [bacterium]|nr:MAG: aminopeptidase [bacterium]